MRSANPRHGRRCGRDRHRAARVRSARQDACPDTRSPHRRTGIPHHTPPRTEGPAPQMPSRPTSGRGRGGGPRARACGGSGRSLRGRGSARSTAAPPGRRGWLAASDRPPVLSICLPGGRLLVRTGLRQERPFNFVVGEGERFFIRQERLRNTPETPQQVGSGRAAQRRPEKQPPSERRPRLPAAASIASPGRPWTAISSVAILWVSYAQGTRARVAY
jgi:hypothetical protein